MGAHTTPPSDTLTQEAGVTPPERPATDGAAPPAARGSRAIAIFGTWMIFGLFLDGWAHQAEKPETFFSPWHAVLYSGFVAAVVWFAIDTRRHPGEPASADRLANAGLVLFVVGAVGDGIWHSLFGIEVDIEALLSPTHLALMIGGALMVTAPVRAARAVLPERPAMRQFAPALASVTLATSLVLFFLMYLAAPWPIADASNAAEHDQGIGIASVLVRSAVMLGATFVVLRRWRPPVGTFTVLWGVPAVALAGLDGFAFIALALPFIVGGLVADAVVARGIGGPRNDLAVAMATPAVTWAGYFAVHAAIWGVHWPAEIWTGAIVFAVLTGLGMTLISPSRIAAPTRG